MCIQYFYELYSRKWYVHIYTHTGAYIIYTRPPRAAECCCLSVYTHLVVCVTHAEHKVCVGKTIISLGRVCLWTNIKTAIDVSMLIQHTHYAAETNTCTELDTEF